jgi:hypothetical protein
VPGTFLSDTAVVYWAALEIELAAYEFEVENDLVQILSHEEIDLHVFRNYDQNRYVWLNATVKDELGKVWEGFDVRFEGVNEHNYSAALDGFCPLLNECMLATAQANPSVIDATDADGKAVALFRRGGPGGPNAGIVTLKATIVQDGADGDSATRTVQWLNEP